MSYDGDLEQQALNVLADSVAAQEGAMPSLVQAPRQPPTHVTRHAVRMRVRAFEDTSR